MPARRLILTLFIGILCGFAAPSFAADPANADAADAGFTDLFDGKSLDGWKAPDMGYWSVEDGAITAKSTDEKPAKGKRGPEAVFKKKDTDGNGSLSKAEFLMGVPDDRTERATARFERADTDGNGSLSLEEFVAAAPKKGGDKPKKKPAKENDNDN